jgi:hypothetical protein
MARGCLRTDQSLQPAILIDEKNNFMFSNLVWSDSFEKHNQEVQQMPAKTRNTDKKMQIHAFVALP